MPEREKFWNIPEAEKKNVDVSYVNTIRGCPYKCTYCASPFHWDRKTTRIEITTISIRRNAFTKK